MLKILVFSLILSNLAFGMPVLSIQRTYKQADGTTFKATPKGDEYLNFLVTPNGDILLYNPKTKNFDYATIKNNSLMPSGIKYTNQNNLKKASIYKQIKKPTKNDLKKIYKIKKDRFKNRN